MANLTIDVNLSPSFFGDRFTSASSSRRQTRDDWSPEAREAAAKARRVKVHSPVGHSTPKANTEGGAHPKRAMDYAHAVHENRSAAHPSHLTNAHAIFHHEFQRTGNEAFRAKRNDIKTAMNNR